MKNSFQFMVVEVAEWVPFWHIKPMLSTLEWDIPSSIQSLYFVWLTQNTMIVSGGKYALQIFWFRIAML
jgi:hypothetical protein